MTLKEIAFRNLMRRKAKALFVLLGLVVGVSTVVAVMGFIETMAGDMNHKLEMYGANILVVPRTESLSLSYGGVFLGGVSVETTEIREAELARLKTIKNAANIAAVGPMVLGAADFGNRQGILAGVDFQSTGILKPWWRVNGAFPDADGVLVGSEAARVLGLERGGRLTVQGKSLQVSGILEPTGSQDDQLVFAPMKTTQTLLDKQGTLSLVEIAALCHGCPITEMVQQISAVLPAAKVTAIQQVVDSRMEALNQFRRISYGIAAILVLVGSLVVLVTMMGSVRERTREIGIFRAIGFRKSQIMRIVFIEAGIISGVAGLLGYLAGMAAAYFISGAMAGHFDLSLRPDLMAGAFGISLLVGLTASIYPALLAARMDPNEALRAF